jgi:DUF4097 and DUF4098 domain-containing protein YvlB
MKAGKIGLLLLILATGAALETAWGLRGGLSIGPEGCRILTGKFHGPSHAFESDQVREGLALPVTLEVDNAFGSVRVAAGEPGRARAHVRKVVFLPSEEKARAFSERVEVGFGLEGQTLRLTTNRRELERDVETARVGVETHIELSVPPGTAVRVRNEHGRVEVQDAREALVTNSYDPVRVERVSGPVEIESRHGDVRVADVAGRLKLSARHGDVEVSTVTGDAWLDVEYGDVTVSKVAGLVARAHHGDVTAEDVGGALDVDAQHSRVAASRVAGAVSIVTSYRDVRLSGAQAGVHVETRHGSVDAEDVAGALVVRASSGEVVARRVGGLLEATVDRGGVQAEDLRKGALVQASGEEVTLEGFEGPVEVRSRRGDIALRPRGALAAPVKATTGSGQVQLELPDGGAFELDARASRGGVTVELPDFAQEQSSPHRVRGRRATGGAAVELVAERGSVRVTSQATPERQP